MRKSFKGKNFQKESFKEFRINEKIFTRELIIIDENGQNLGPMPKEQALAEAQARGLDLVEVSPKAETPIAKFMNYGSFKYQREKMERKAKAKQKTIEIKTIKLSTRIGQHDMAFRIEQAVKFLKGGDKVKIEIQLRGRENQHADLARETIRRTINEIQIKSENKILKIEQELKQLGNKFSAIVSY